MLTFLIKKYKIFDGIKEKKVRENKRELKVEERV